jgi:hypothetical protein
MMLPGLEVTVDEAGAVRFVERFADFYSYSQGFFQREASLSRTLGKSLAFEILHYQKVEPILMTDVV